MIRVALLSKWHVHAVDYAAQAKENDHIEITHVWDEDETRGQEWANELGVKFEKELDEVFANPEIDAVIVDTPTFMHRDVIINAAKSKKHIFTEKVLALTVADSQAILEAVAENEVMLMVSLPRLAANYYLYAQEVLDKGLLGKLTTIRCRVAHNGAVATEERPHGWLPTHFFNFEECGGGAFIDLGAHPIYLTNRLGGEVTAVTARLKQTFDYEVDDNAVAVVEYASGALGILETSFVSNGSPFQLELYGTEGTLMIEDNKIRLKSNLLENDWHQSDLSELSASLPMPMEQWVNQILTGQPPSITHQDGHNLTLINQAARLSHDQNRRVETKELVK
ncbi:Gfo/Idh/MocA family protein [Sutcliffiella halmapala]|uniref:Gfo/Idh/MocA family protein n=1 Tax=Sutcliffiella halmapala TaxID=79882 RepID=UPI0009955657|nr:Gfo/Idh/MocA family oxidoreductase [Sutcliffiella halmapala]